MNLNKVIVAGRMTSDPELKQTKKGTDVVNFSVATNSYYKGEKKGTEFHRCTAFGKTAEIISKYTKKGSVILVEGKLKTRSWKDRNGNKKRKTEIIAKNVQLGKKKEKKKEPKKESPSNEGYSDDLDEIPGW